jgi:hypothetical protein
MDPKTELLHRLSIALTRGQGGFTEEDLALAFEEVFNMLVQGQLGNLIMEGELNLRINEGTVLYSAAKDGQGPEEPLPLETLIENMRSTEDR